MKGVVKSFWLLAGALALLLLFLTAFSAYPLIRSLFDFQVSYNEGWNAYHQRDAVSGILYPHALGYVFTNYTPLSFYFVGYLSQQGDPIFVGRIVSIISFFVLIAATGLTARNLGSSRAESLLAAALSVALIGGLHDDRIGVNDPQLLVTAVSVIGLLVWSQAPSRLLQNAAALFIFAVAGLIKQTAFVIPAAIACELFFRDRLVGVRFFLMGSVMAMAALCALYGVFGSDIFSQLLSPRTYSVHEAGGKTLRYLAESSLSLPFVLVFLGAHAGQGANRFVLIYLVLALLAGALLSGGAGVDSNIFIDVEVALSLATALVIRCLRADMNARPGLIAAFVALSIYGPSLHIPYALRRLRDGLAGGLRADEAEFRRDVAFVRAASGPAFCNSPMLCFRAGRPFAIDAFNASQAIRLNRVDATPLAAAMAHGAFAVVQLTVSGANSFGPPMAGGPDRD